MGLKWQLSNRNEGNLVLKGQLFESILFEQQRFGGLEGEDGNARRGADFQCLRSETRDVEAEIVLLPGNFNGHGAAVRTGQLAAARQASVGSFKGFHRQHGAALDEDGLAYFKARNLLCHAKAEVHVSLVRLRELRPEPEAAGGHEGAEPGGGLDQLNAILLRSEEHTSQL